MFLHEQVHDRSHGHGHARSGSEVAAGQGEFIG
jgi:hypothetical protein